MRKSPMKYIKVSLRESQIKKIKAYANKYTDGNFSLALRLLVQNAEITTKSI